jgi:hypothetical protein
MASRNFIVYFACPACGVCYRAIQERCCTVQPKRFSCEDCKSVVYRWFASYDYAGWQRYENIRPAAKRSVRLH